MVNLDAFFCEEAQVESPDDLPKQVKIAKGCALELDKLYISYYMSQSGIWRYIS